MAGRTPKAVIMSAPLGGGGGIFTVSGTITLTGGRHSGDTVTVTLAVTAT